MRLDSFCNVLAQENVIPFVSIFDYFHIRQQKHTSELHNSIFILRKYVISLYKAFIE